MAKVPSHPTRIWLDQYALSGYLTASELKVEQETFKVECFSDTGPRRLVGNYDHMGSHTGLFDAADDALDPVLWAHLAADTDHYLAQAFGSAAENAVVYERVVRLKAQPRKAATGAALLLNFEEEGSGPLVRGRILRSASVTGTGNGTGRNLGATSSGALTVVTYRVLAVSGTGSITLQCQESSDDGAGDAYASVAALASGALTTVGVTRKTTTGATEAWKRISVSAFSGFTSVTILATVGTAANT